MRTISVEIVAAVAAVSRGDGGCWSGESDTWLLRTKGLGPRGPDAGETAASRPSRTGQAHGRVLNRALTRTVEPTPVRPPAGIVVERYRSRYCRSRRSSTVSAPDTSRTDGEVLSRVSTALVGLHKEYYGKGPTRAKTFL